MDAALEDRLSAVVERWYPERLQFEDLARYEFVIAVEQAAKELLEVGGRSV